MKLNEKTIIEADFWKGTMSDIAFLLIIFFILTAVFSIPYMIRFTTNNAVVELADKKELITVEITEDGTWKMDNQYITKNELIESLVNTKKYRLHVNDKRPYQDFIDILNIFHEADISQIEVVTEQ